MFDDKLIADIEDDDFSDFIDLKFNIEGPYSLKYTYEELEPNFKFKNTLPIVKFNICTLINEGISVDDAVFHIGKENKIDPYSLKTELIDEGYIVEGLNVNDLKNKYETYNPKQLKKILKKYKLKRSGSKEELIERLIENIPEDEIPFDSYKLSPKAKKLIQDNLYYSSTIVSNLGSIKSNAIHHNITNFGTCSSLITMGEIHNKEIIDNDNNKKIIKACDWGMAFDERVADGFYLIKSIELLQYIFDNPELLEHNASEIIDYQKK